MSLKDRLKAEIAATGPMTVAQYMTACLFDPHGGYYTTRPRLGADGDFITAPMVSQMFGELIGLWAAEVWAGMGRPGRVRLVEVGPGDGALIGDALRAAKAAPGFLHAVELVLVEVSAPLKALQATRLADAPLEPRWIEGLSELPAGPPVILIANEVLDCLPVRQFVVTDDGWSERVVGLDAHGELSFGALPPRPPPPMSHLAGSGVVEVSEAQQAFGSQVGEIVRRDTGAALLIDYGRDAPGYGDTLQALKDHRKIDPLESPGAADITVHADFPAVLAAARDAGAAAARILTQGDFLRRLGIDQRAAALARARPNKTEVLSRQLQRLIGDDEMGRLFKAAAIHWPASPPPPAFEEV
jgi:SAM-dependent MidA family methyltransferase